MKIKYRDGSIRDLQVIEDNHGTYDNYSQYLTIEALLDKIRDQENTINFYKEKYPEEEKVDWLYDSTDKDIDDFGE